MNKKRTETTLKKKVVVKKAGEAVHFTLRNVNTEKIDQVYGLGPLEQSKQIVPAHTTKLSDLTSCKHETVSYLDDAKKTKMGILFVVDLNNVTYNGQYHCYWDHHPIGPVQPIGCPVEYIFSQAVRNYFSEVSKNKYTIRENLTRKSVVGLCQKKNKGVDPECPVSNKIVEILKNFSEEGEKKRKPADSNFDHMGLLSRDHYVTDGIFCSFNCCLAFILENFRDPLYKDSEQLLYKMYADVFGGPAEKITPANHWRTLAIYGGKVSIGKFRQNLESIEYAAQGVIKMRPIAHIYEEKYKL